MSIKTPERVARETLGADALGGIGYEQYIPYMVAAIKADRAERTEPVVVIRDGCAYEGEGVEVIDLDFLGPGAVTRQSDFDQDDIDRMLATLERAGFQSVADDVREWWADR